MAQYLSPIKCATGCQHPRRPSPPQEVTTATSREEADRLVGLYKTELGNDWKVYAEE